MQFSVENLDKLYNEWSSLPLLSDNFFDVGQMYSEVSAEARQSLIDLYNWSLNDAGQLIISYANLFNAFTVDDPIRLPLIRECH